MCTTVVTIMYHLALFVFFILWNKVELVKVKIDDGWLDGKSRPLCTGLGTVYSFQGIPYAEPPVGELRFKAPQPRKEWNGVRNAKNQGPICIQYDVFTDQFIHGSEDCLFLNVYTPTLAPPEPLPVMFFIHGGGWKSGSGNDDKFGPDYLVRYDVILVTINYRLDVLGNLCLHTKDVPGNAGMKDQVLALKWVQKNIHHFGGDPNAVTIIGQSAGGASVVYHMMSPMSKGLFKRAITMSGVQLGDVSIPFYSKERAFLLGKLLGKTTNNADKLLKFLQNVPVDNLINPTPNLLSQETLWANNPLLMFPFVPVAEKDFGQDRFLINTPKEILRQGNIQDVDLMTGYTDKENSFIIPKLEANYTFDSLNLEDFGLYKELMVPREILLGIPPNEVIPLATGIQSHYFADEPISKETMSELIDHSDDHTFKYNTNRFVKYLPIRNSKLYFYKFYLVSDRNQYREGEEYGIHGCAHTDDLRYLFSDSSHLDANSREYQLIDLTCSLFTNFVKYGDPTPDNSSDAKWLPYNYYDRNYMQIKDIITPAKDPDAEIVNWWTDIYTRNNIPMP